MVNVKQDILKVAPKNAKIADFYKIPSNKLVFPSIEGDEYIARIELPGVDFLPNSYYIWKNGKVDVIHTRLVPMI